MQEEDVVQGQGQIRQQPDQLCPVRGPAQLLQLVAAVELLLPQTGVLSADLGDALVQPRDIVRAGIHRTLDHRRLAGQLLEDPLPPGEILLEDEQILAGGRQLAVEGVQQSRGPRPHLVPAHCVPGNLWVADLLQQAFGQPLGFDQLWVQQVEAVQQRVVNGQPHVGRQPQLDLEPVQLRLKVRLGGQQPALRVVQRLSCQFDLEEIDPPSRLKLGLQRCEAVAEGDDVQLLILQLLPGLQQSQETAGLSGARPRAYRAVDTHNAQAAEAGGAHAGETFQARSTGQAPAARGPRTRIQTGHDLGVKTLAKPFHLADVGQQLAFGHRQPLQHPRSTPSPQERLNQAEVQDRGSRVALGTGKLPDQ